VLGGILCVNDSNAVFEWFVCGEETSETNIYPSVMATWTGIKYAAENNFSRFDFMGAGKPAKSYGVREFKAKFGGKLVENGRFLYICKPLLYKIGKAAIQMSKIF
jgi:lipid II:glycine glycyltransferase (peptidoglycan interpeptide bridge formation enzyme)